MVLSILRCEYGRKANGSLVDTASLCNCIYVIGSASSTFCVGAEIEFSKRKLTFAGPSLPSLVVTRITPFAPRAPYNAVAVAFLMLEKLAMSTGWSRERSVDGKSHRLNHSHKC